MAEEAGDIIIYRGSPGHVGMYFDADTVIHAQMTGNFHKQPNHSVTGGTDSYMSDGANVFRPPWDKCPNKAVRIAELQRIAEGMAKSAKYGAYRAIRLWAGNSTYGPNAAARLQKYRDRARNGFHDSSGKDKFVTTVTCSEAVILCYQLTFADGLEPFFILLDAAHSMPSTLRTWLTTNWTKVQ